VIAASSVTEPPEVRLTVPVVVIAELRTRLPGRLMARSVEPMAAVEAGRKTLSAAALDRLLQGEQLIERLRRRRQFVERQRVGDQRDGGAGAGDPGHQRRPFAAAEQGGDDMAVVAPEPSGMAKLQLPSAAVVKGPYMTPLTTMLTVAPATGAPVLVATLPVSVMVATAAVVDLPTVAGVGTG
jgi:hypothetical protein